MNVGENGSLSNSEGGQLNTDRTEVSGSVDNAGTITGTGEESKVIVSEGEIVTLDESYTFTAKSDSVYELSATWDDETVGGTLSWGFQTCADGA